MTLPYLFYTFSLWLIIDRLYYFISVDRNQENTDEKQETFLDNSTWQPISWELHTKTCASYENHELKKQVHNYATNKCN